MPREFEYPPGRGGPGVDYSDFSFVSSFGAIFESGRAILEWPETSWSRKENEYVEAFPGRFLAPPTYSRSVSPESLILTAGPVVQKAFLWKTLDPFDAVCILMLLRKSRFLVRIRRSSP